MTVTEVVSAVEEAGGALALKGSRIKYAIPRRAAWLVSELQQQREGIVALLQRRAAMPPMPAGICLVRWAPKQPPVVLEHCSVVIDVDKFIFATLAQLQACLQGKNWLAGNWSIRDLTERLEQVGVVVELTA